MINFEHIMNMATREAAHNAARRFSEKSEPTDFEQSLDPEDKELIEQNKTNIILMEEMVKAGLKHYHKALEQEIRNKSRLSF